MQFLWFVLSSSRILSLVLAVFLPLPLSLYISRSHHVFLMKDILAFMMPAMPTVTGFKPNPVQFAPVQFGRRRDPNQVVILDTTLRDGSQTPGVNLKPDDRLAIARALAAVGVNVIEAGFPISSPDNAHSVRQIASTVGQGDDAPTIAGFGRTGRFQQGSFVAPDIDAVWTAVQAATSPRIHIVGTGSDLHLREKYRSEGPEGRTREENLRIVVESVARARHMMAAAGKTPDIEFSPEDCGRADPKYLAALYGAAIKAGLTVANVPDTTGNNLFDQYGDLFRVLRRETPGADTVTWSTHAHDDLGMATANALAGVKNGARQVEGTIDGLGERTGNTAIEQIATIFKLQGQRLGGLFTTIDLPNIQKVAQLVARLSGMPIHPQAPIVGRNAFRHRSGMHQDGILKDRRVYQDIDPALVGREIELELGPDSGKAGVFYTANRLGYTVPADRRDGVFEQFKTLADRVGMVDDTALSELLEGIPGVTKRPVDTDA